ncbi:hypothetical protein [Gimesia maris]|uniref:hypothetical protein n=1 Tax=Gimesia maris TaxID=122 RepID=UPI0032F016C5|tara:strand:+ start:13565 stop:14080 length:516 start_codon:yes stop_codon:yes gene_type:complete
MKPMEAESPGSEPPERDWKNQPFLKNRKEGSVELIVPRIGDYLPLPVWVRAADLLSLILIPLWIIFYSIADSIYHFEVPPRAVFRISTDLLQMTFVSKDGEKLKFEYPREKVVEFRKNRYESGFWLRVAGVTMESHQTDLDDEVVTAICEEFWKISSEFDERKALNESFNE